MLKINLLPESLQKATSSPIEQFYRTPLIWVVVVGVVVFPLLFWIPTVMRRQELAKLHAKVQSLEPKKAHVDRLQEALTKLRAEETAYKGLRRGTGWSKRLNTLSDLTPSGVWFTDFSLDQRELIIQGSAIGSGDPQMASVTKLVQELKADADFAAVVKDIQIESIKRVPEGDLELVQFTLTCPLAEALMSPVQ